MREIWVVRHGATDWSEAGRFNGWTDVPLNERGRAQARRLPSLLPRSGFEGVWTSDLARSIETATIAVGDESVADTRLRELDFGRIEGKRWDECSTKVRQDLTSFEGFAAPGGESVIRLRERVGEFLRSLDEGAHLVVTHGGVIRLLLRAQGRDRVSIPCCEPLALGPLPEEMLEGA